LLPSVKGEKNMSSLEQYAPGAASGAEVRKDGEKWKPRTKTVVAFWITTAVFSLWMLFTAYWELWAPQAAETFTQLGFPAHFFRVELSLAKVAGVAVLLLPTPQRLKEWAYAGFAINLGSAFIAHLATGHGAYQTSMVAGAILALAYYFNWKRASET
jgi:hypothetical protein